MVLHWLMYYLYLKKEDRLRKENYRLVSILIHISKVSERIFSKQIDVFMTTKFSPCLCGFRKYHNTLNICS